MEKLEKFLKARKIEFVSGREIKPYLSIGIGGSDETIIVVPAPVDLRELLLFLDARRYRFILLGGGSNVVFPDDHIPFPVIVNRTSQMVKLPGEGLVKVNSGVFNKDFLAWAIESRVGGLDYLAGIPGTLGGAAAVNAGSFGLSISMALEKADIFVPGAGEIRTVDNDYFKFEYRNSKFKYGSEVILDIYLRYTDTDSDKIREKVDEKVRYREEKHPPRGTRTAGCFFKNPIIGGQKVSAGKLIESAGFKGTRLNCLEVSAMHSNFVVNNGESTFENILSLEREIVRAVREQKGITLEREVIYISPEGKKY